MVQVYVADQNVLFKSCDPWQVLSEQEKERAERFVFERDKQNFIVAHAVKRLVLAKHLQLQPASLQFEHGLKGKPNLIGYPLHFNLSHSHDLMALSVSKHSPVGVDVEVMRDNLDAQSLADRFFAPAESAVIDGDRKRFYRYWVAKEAILKAEGEGIAENLADVVLTTSNQDELGIISLPLHFSSAENWCLREFIPAENAFAAVAMPAEITGLEIIKLKFM